MRTIADNNDTSSSSEEQSLHHEYRLTTSDNPYDPFTQWDEWYVWDERAGYCSCGFLARIAHHSNELSELDQYLAIQNAIDEIVRENVTGMHMKVKRGDIVVRT